MGGLSKKAYQIERIVKYNKKPHLILDGGGLLFKKEFLSPGRQEPEKITATGILEALNIMKVDAVGIGKQDLAAGLSFLVDKKKQTKFKWLSANIVRQSDKKTIFTPGIIKQVGNISVGITGITGLPSNKPFRPNDDAALQSWKKNLPRMIDELVKTSDLIILLSSLSPQENNVIAATYDTIHIILQTNSRSSNLRPIMNNNTLIIQTGNKGKYLGRLDVNWQGSKMWQTPSLRSIENKRREIEHLNRQINLSKNNKHLLERKKQLVAQLQLLESQQNIVKKTAWTPSTHKNVFIPLDRNLPDQPEVLKVVQNIKTEINKQGRLSAKRDRQRKTTRPDNYAGWHTCVKCHQAQYKVWKKSRHARAHQTLISKKQQYNRMCIPCHVTGVSTGKEPYALTLQNGLRQVGCEACHGPGKKHNKVQRNNKLVSIPAKKTCKRCHTKERDPSFNYTKDLESLACSTVNH